MVNPAHVLNADEHPPRFLKYISELLAGKTNCRRVHDGHHFFHVFGEHVEEQLFIYFCYAHNKLVLLKIAFSGIEIPKYPLRLFLESLELRRKKPMQVQFPSFRKRKCHALITGRIFQQ